MTVYADELFIVNFISCLCMLYVFAAFADLERRRLRLIFASFYGALTAVFRFCTGIDMIMLFEILIPFIAFKKVSFKSVILFMLSKYLFSGIAVAVVSLIGSSSAVIRSGVIYFNISPLLFLAVFCIVYPVFSVTLSLIKQHRQKRRIYTLVINGVPVKALYDSGNVLKNPYDGSGMVILEQGVVDFNEDAGFMLIPYRALNHSSIIKGFKAENVFCIEKNLKIKKITIGISENALSQSGDYQALTGPAVFKE